MKKPKLILLLYGIAAITLSCSATNRLTLGVTEPPRIVLPKNVTKIGIIDRSIPSEENSTLDKLDKILSMEGKYLDKEGAEFALQGLMDALKEDNRFQVVKIIDDVEGQRKGLSVFPAALPSPVIAKICDENNVEILFSLEFYDTDTAVDYALTSVRVPNDLGVDITVPGHRLTLNTIVKNGWRIYDSRSKSVLDEYVYRDHITAVGEGINPVKAYEAIAGRKEGVMQMSGNMGMDYGYFIQPKQIRVARDYFVRGTDNFKTAMRRARTGNWNGAADLWAMELNHQKAKVSGRAHYNMAIINEINGDLEKALEFASASYADYGTKLGLNYVNLLRQRIAQQKQLEASQGELSK